ncbi:Protein OBERON 2 [Camellia lanceoleosa]|uniref:Protein OBERON 2 n=1 Tax=Camellia lanceoleosa TaxID=1840588 RepID=A0ACC0FIN0_9ERIC|nr:Protein OBERON 2 [Camellia lanceoleosa]
MDSSRNPESGEDRRVIAPQEACNQIAEVVQEALKKMEMVADEKMRMFKKAHQALEASELELDEKAREVVELKSTGYWIGPCNHHYKEGGYDSIHFEVDLILWITILNVCKDGGIIKKVIEKGEQIGPLTSQFLSKIEIRNLNKLWHHWEREKVEYFTLADLWNSFDEWSAYDAYVPYLFAIHIFTSKSLANSLSGDDNHWTEVLDVVFHVT